MTDGDHVHGSTVFGGCVLGVCVAGCFGRVVCVCVCVVSVFRVCVQCVYSLCVLRVCIVLSLQLSIVDFSCRQDRQDRECRAGETASASTPGVLSSCRVIHLPQQAPGGLPLPFRMRGLPLPSRMRGLPLPFKECSTSVDSSTTQPRTTQKDMATPIAVPSCGPRSLSQVRGATESSRQLLALTSLAAGTEWTG